MDWKELVASLVSSLAWPAAIMVLVVVLRKQLAAGVGRLIDRVWLSKLKAGPSGLEAEFRQLLDQAGTTSVPPCGVE